MAEETNQSLPPPSSSSSSSSTSSAPRSSAPPGGGAQRAVDNDENCFENQFNFMMEAVRRLQLDGLRVMLVEVDTQTEQTREVREIGCRIRMFVSWGGVMKKLV